MTLITALLSLSVLVVLCTAQQLSEGPSRDEYGWSDENPYRQQDKRGFGQLKFGKRPFGSIKFGKRVPEPSMYRNAYVPDDTIDPILPDPSKRYTDMLDNLYFQSLINKMKGADDVMNKRMAGNLGDNKRAKIKFGKKSYGPVENDLMTEKERNLKQSLDSKYGKSPYTSF